MAGYTECFVQNPSAWPQSHQKKGRRSPRSRGIDPALQKQSNLLVRNSRLAKKKAIEDLNAYIDGSSSSEETKDDKIIVIDAATKEEKSEVSPGTIKKKRLSKIAMKPSTAGKNSDLKGMLTMKSYAKLTTDPRDLTSIKASTPTKRKTDNEKSTPKKKKKSNEDSKKTTKKKKPTKSEEKNTSKAEKLKKKRTTK